MGLITESEVIVVEKKICSSRINFKRLGNKVDTFCEVMSFKQYIFAQKTNFQLLRCKIKFNLSRLTKLSKAHQGSPWFTEAH